MQQMLHKGNENAGGEGGGKRNCERQGERLMAVSHGSAKTRGAWVARRGKCCKSGYKLLRR